MIALALAVLLVPDPLVTPGIIDSSATVEKLCTPGYTKTVRPPASYTNGLKREQMMERGLVGDPSGYEEDHRLPLELGGSPTDPMNLWPEVWADARRKDVVETRLHRCLCTGRITLEQAQAVFLGDYSAAYDRLKAGEKCPVGVAEPTAIEPVDDLDEETVRADE